MAGQVVMLDVRDRFNPEQLSGVSLGANAGPHNIVLNGDDGPDTVTAYVLRQIQLLAHPIATVLRCRPVPNLGQWVCCHRIASQI
jgi:hypothetical protein